MGAGRKAGISLLLTACALAPAVAASVLKKCKGALADWIWASIATKPARLGRGRA